MGTTMSADTDKNNNNKIYGDSDISPLALIYFQKWDHVTNKSNNECFEIQSMLPIHYAFQKGAPLPVIKALHEAYIKNIETSFSNMNSYYSYLIPTTSNTNKNKAAPKEVIKFLHEKYPQGIETRTSEGNLLLHTACHNNTSLDIVQYLLRHYPRGITIRNYFGRLPLHCACSANSSLEIIKYLCDMCPKAIEVSDNYGDYPIDIAFQHGASNDIVDYLSNFIVDDNDSTTSSSDEELENSISFLDEPNNEKLPMLLHKKSMWGLSTSLSAQAARTA